MGLKSDFKQYLPAFVREDLSELARLRTEAKVSRLSDVERLKRLEKYFASRTGEQLDLTNPITFNQKVQWLKVYDSTPQKGRLADKYLVREFIANTIGEEYLVPLLGVWDDVAEIDFNSLPRRYALKATHGSAWNIIVDGKEKINEHRVKHRLSQWLRRRYWLGDGYELHYKWCEPRIVAEQYVEGSQEFGLIDYKFHMFNSGEPIVLVCANRFEGHKPRKSYYDLDWNKIDLLEEGSESFDCPRPQRLDEMIELSRTLASGFAMVRVDWYETVDRLHFGELTFTPANGMKRFVPDDWNYEFGKCIDLSKIDV